MKLSKNFTLQEFTKSQVAIRNGIDNVPTEEHIEAARLLFDNVVQPVRDHFGPTIITSGYRGKQLNTIVNGSSNSQHCKGEAVDLEVPGYSNMEVAEWISNNTPFDQLILEFYTPGIPDSGWVHVSYNDSHRRQILTSTKDQGGYTKYMPGLIT